MSTLDIDAVARLCARMGAAGKVLFETTGGWVTETDDAHLRRVWSIASHRHAWHAELWSDRMPAIPDRPTADELVPPGAVEAPADAAACRQMLDALIDELEDATSGVDPLLDPGTCRVIDLVTADLRSIRSQL